jgi:hypothetical protein
MIEEIHMGENFIECVLPTLAHRDLVEHLWERINISKFVPVVVVQCIFLDFGMIFLNPIHELCSLLNCHVNKAKPWIPTYVIIPRQGPANLGLKVVVNAGRAPHIYTQVIEFPQNTKLPPFLGSLCLRNNAPILLFRVAYTATHTPHQSPLSHPPKSSLLYSERGRLKR